LQDKVLDQPANVIVSKRGADGGFESETATETASDIVFAAAFPGLEFSCGSNTTFTGVEAEHDFAEGDHVVLAGTGGFQRQSGHGVFWFDC
jgi:hypothetical protein